MEKSKRRRINGNDSANNTVGEGLIELEVLSISGECMLILNVAHSMLGRELWTTILDKVPFKPGRLLVLSHNTSKLALNESLQHQDIKDFGVSGNRCPLPTCPSICLPPCVLPTDTGLRMKSSHWLGLQKWQGLVRKCVPCCAICPTAFTPWLLIGISIRKFIT